MCVFSNGNCEMEVLPKLVEVNSCDATTEFDWRDYDYADDLYVPDNLDDNSDLDDCDEWNYIANKRKEDHLQEENVDHEYMSSSLVSSADSNASTRQRPGTPILDSFCNRRAPPRVQFKQSMDEIFHIPFYSVHPAGF